VLLRSYGDALELQSWSSARASQEEIDMSRKMWMGLGVGAALAYFASPRSRRAQFNQQFMRAGEKARQAYESTRRVVADRTASMIDNSHTQWSSKPQGVSSR
jgi:hypothetical protein